MIIDNSTMCVKITHSIINEIKKKITELPGLISSLV